MFRELIPLLADRFRLIAPDLPGFGQSDSPGHGCTFDRIASTIDRFTEVVGLDRYAVYVFDYGAPTGFRLAVAHPERITAIISQNDPFFLPAGAEAFKRDIPDAVVRFVDTGHFALETHTRPRSRRLSSTSCPTGIHRDDAGGVSSA